MCLKLTGYVFAYTNVVETKLMPHPAITHEMWVSVFLSVSAYSPIIFAIYLRIWPYINW